MFKISKKEIYDVHEGTVSDELLERAIEYTMTNGEMPYGVQKARTGDPYNWASNWLSTNFDKETEMSTFTTEMMQELETRLKSEILEVTFTKVNGDTRVMRCTRDFTSVPSDMLPKQDALPTTQSDTMVRVFDVEKQDWRGFRKDSVISFGVAV